MIPCVQCGRTGGLLHISDGNDHSATSCIQCLGLVVGLFMLDCNVFRVELRAVDSAGILG